MIATNKNHKQKRRDKTLAKVTLIPAVACYRMSDNKQEASIGQQRAEVERYAEQNGYRIIRWKPYVDEGISGSESDKRPGFQRLIHDAQEKQDFEVILCWDQDRFSRFDPLEANHYWYLLREAGVRIVTVAQGELDLSTLGGWLTASVAQHGKAEYLKDLSRNVLRGRLARALEGKWVGSRPPYGFSVDDGDLLLGAEEQVWAVREIFKQYTSAARSLNDIAHKLNERSIPAPSGQLWTGQAVRTILRREAYKGTAIQFRDSKGKFHTIKDSQVVINSGHSRKSEEEWFVVKCPQIVDEATWDRAQDRLVSRRGKTSPTRSGGNLLTGLLYCGHCGARMIGADRRTTSAGDLVYVCGTYHKHGIHRCNRNLIHQTPILTFLGENIRETILAPKNFEKLRAAVGRKLKDRRKSEPADTTRMRKQLASLDAELKKAMTELRRTPDDLYDLAVDEVRQIRQRRDNVAAELTDAEARQHAHTSPVESDVERVLGRVQLLREGLSSVDPAISRNTLSEVCERVDLWFEHTSFNGKNSRPMVRSKFDRGLVSFKDANLLLQANRPGSRRR